MTPGLAEQQRIIAAQFAAAKEPSVPTCIPSARGCKAAVECEIRRPSLIRRLITALRKR